MKQPLPSVPPDRDRAEIEALLDSVASTRDRDLPRLLETVAQEVESHFAREEKLLAKPRAPVLESRHAQHAMILREIATVLHLASHVDAATVRRLLNLILPALIDANVASLDRIAADL